MFFCDPFWFRGKFNELSSGWPVLLSIDISFTISRLSLSTYSNTIDLFKLCVTFSPFKSSLPSSNAFPTSLITFSTFSLLIFFPLPPQLPYFPLLSSPSSPHLSPPFPSVTVFTAPSYPLLLRATTCLLHLTAPFSSMVWRTTRP